MPISAAVALVAVLLLVGCETPSASPSALVTASPTAAPSLAGSPTEQPTPQPPGWRELAPEGATPAPREDATWTLDGTGQVAYLVDGRDSDTVYGDFWAYHLATGEWTQGVAEGSYPVGPAARFGHSAAWVPGVGLVVFAGQNDEGFLNDLWAYDPAHDAWRQLPASGAVPVPRYGSCAALGPDGRLWISHGFTSDGTRYADTRAYDFATGTWTDETPEGEAPVERCLHGCWWTADGRFVLFAGQTTGVTALGDLWELTVGPPPGTTAWTEVIPDAGNLPAARNLYGLAYRPDRAIVFGGLGADGTYLNDLWEFGDAVLGADSLDAENSPPPARSGAELVITPDGSVLVFGGTARGTAFGDLWRWGP